MTPWNDEQQRLLRAMGYVLYARAPAPTALPLPETQPVKTAESTAMDFNRLLRSLQNAAMGRDVSGVLTDVAALRGNARAKRALWPKLRALRRPH